MKSHIYMLVGVPGSGKTWVADQVKSELDYLPHDDFPNHKVYVSAIKQLATNNPKSVLIETPFSVSDIFTPLTESLFRITPLFIIESLETTTQRYEKREGKAIPPGHLTRINTYLDRAYELDAFVGTSEQVLVHLNRLIKKETK